MKNIFLGPTNKRNRYILGGGLLSTTIVLVVVSFVLTKNEDHVGPSERPLVKTTVVPTMKEGARARANPTDLDTESGKQKSGGRDDLGWGRQLHPKRPETTTTTPKPLETESTKKPIVSVSTWITTPHGKPPLSGPRR